MKIRVYSAGPTPSLSTVLKLALLICLGLAATVNIRAESDLTARFHSRYYENIADQLYLTREIPKNIELAIDYYKKAIAAEPERPGIHWKITRCYWVLATKRSVSKEERLKHLREGIRFGKIAINTDTSNSNAFLWHALVHGDNALVKGVMNTIYMRTQIREWLEKAVQLNPKNVNAILGLAGWYYHIPEFLGGDKAKTFQLIEQAEKVDPLYTAIYIQKAQYLISEKKYDQAAAVLNHVLHVETPRLRNDGAEDKATSQQLLDMLKTEGHLTSDQTPLTGSSPG
ncbi:hypothetical protein KKI24_00670 [bacterium]|nr:hypothetical protein [bacterium]